MAWRALALSSHKSRDQHKTSGSRLIGLIACCSEVVVAFLLGEEIADVSDSLPEGVVGSGGCFADQGFEFGECHLDGVQVGAVGWQGQEPCADVAEHFGGLWRFMAGEVVEDDDVAFAQRRDQLGLDVKVEQFAVDRAVDDPWRVQSVVPEGGNEGLGIPVAKGRVAYQPLADRSPAGGLDEIGLEGGFIDEGQPFQKVAHEGLALHSPTVTRSCDFGPLGLTGQQSFFYD
jgi:hypothetical protein